MRGTSRPKSPPEHKAAFDATVIPGVAYTHPEVAWVGYTEAQAKAEGKKVNTAKFPWAATAARSPTAPTTASPS